MEIINQYLPPILAILTPLVVSLVRSGADTFVGKIPKPFIPVLAAAIGALGEALATGGVTSMGLSAGAAGVAVREVIHQAGKKGG